MILSCFGISKEVCFKTTSLKICQFYFSASNLKDSSYDSSSWLFLVTIIEEGGHLTLPRNLSTSRIACGTIYLQTETGGNTLGRKCMYWECFHSQKIMWMCMGLWKLVRLKNEVAYNWVTDHNTPKNYSTSGWWAVHETLTVDAAISQLIHYKRKWLWHVINTLSEGSRVKLAVAAGPLIRKNITYSYS